MPGHWVKYQNALFADAGKRKPGHQGIICREDMQNVSPPILMSFYPTELFLFVNFLPITAIAMHKAFIYTLCTIKKSKSQ